MSGRSGAIRYRVELLDSARAERRQLAPDPRSRVKEIIRSLSAGPFEAPEAKPLDQYESKWTVPAGDLRIVFEIDWDARQIVIERIRHRRDAYEGLRPRRPRR